MIRLLWGLLSLYPLLTCCQAQEKTSVPVSSPSTAKVGSGCDGCELMYVGMPDDIKSEHTSAGWEEDGQPLMITGVVYKRDGKTPAPNVVVYYWHTNNEGLYADRPSVPTQAKPHGYLRGWIKTGSDGKYTIKTSRPAPYPNANIPAHIHLSVKEPNLPNEYYLDLFFDDDPLYLQQVKRSGRENRGGTEILRVLLQGKRQIAEHNIILGLNIPNYPSSETSSVESGLSIGEDQPSFMPFHAYGPDKGSRTCPVCKYGRYHGIMYFVGDRPNWGEIKAWLSFLEKESSQRSTYLKAYFVYGNSQDNEASKRQRELEKLGRELNIFNVALTYVPSFSDAESEANLNKINPSVENTFIVYKHRTIVAKFVNLSPTEQNFQLITATLNKTQGDYFNLPEPPHD
jgi:protocatechuate 3,4-dioxygenase beta subunit